MRFRDLVQRGKRPWPPSPKGADLVTINPQSQTNDDKSISGTHKADTDGASQDVSEGVLPIQLSDMQNHRLPDAIVEVGQLSSWGSLWAEAYRTVKDDPEYTRLFDAFESYLREAETGM